MVIISNQLVYQLYYEFQQEDCDVDSTVSFIVHDSPELTIAKRSNNL